MSAFSASDFTTGEYNHYRPHYPSKLFEKLFEYHKGQFDNAVDIGCGPGEATYPLLRKFNKVVGTDISKVMVDEANLHIPSDLRDRIEFIVSPAEKLESIEDESVDLITAAECIHWFNHDAFFKEIARVLKPNGTLAFWGYSDPILIDYEGSKEIYTKVVYGDDGLGPYWQQPGISILRSRFNITPSSDFVDVERVAFIPKETLIKNDTILVAKQYKGPDSFLRYIKTWSSYHNWKKVNSGKNIPDVLDGFVEELKSKYNWNDQTRINVEWEFTYVFSRKL